MACVGPYMTLDPNDQASKGLLVYLRPLLPILAFTPHFADLFQLAFYRFAILKEHQIFVCLLIICLDGASVDFSL